MDSLDVYWVMDWANSVIDGRSADGDRLNEREYSPERL